MLLKDWRGSRPANLTKEWSWPFIELIAWKSNFYRGNSGDAVAQYTRHPGWRGFAFQSGPMDAMPDPVVEAVIAHELAHAVLCIYDAAYHLDPANTKYVNIGGLEYSQSEADADDMACAHWGFDRDACSKWWSGPEGRALLEVQRREADEWK